MSTYEDIEARFKHLNAAQKLLIRKEMKALPDILWEDEILEQAVQGIYERRNGILCATNKRLLFVEKGVLSGLKVEDFPYDKITSIQYHTGFVFGTIKLYASGNTASMSQIEKESAKQFSDYVRARITKKSEHAAVTPNTDDDLTNRLDALERLAKLKEQGILTEDEFQAQKQAILK